MPDEIYECVTKTAILRYYREIWDGFFDEVGNHNLGIVFIYGKSTIFARNDKSTGLPYRIGSFGDLERIVNRHGIEIVPDLETIDEPGRTRTGVVDVDSYTSVERTKKLVRIVHDRLRKLGHDAYIVSTGSRSGFHVRYDICEPAPFAAVKRYLLENVIRWAWNNVEGVKDLMLDPDRLSYPVIQKKASNKCFIDLASLKDRGGVKAVGTINAKNGALVRVVDPRRLPSFKPIPWEICKF